MVVGCCDTEGGGPPGTRLPTTIAGASVGVAAMFARAPTTTAMLSSGAGGLEALELGGGRKADFFLRAIV